ncbi:hypothetical protein [Natrarchaeobaculum aegyptiacum]|uniref:Uncharacterized protein n=1 Tax=Natrarchaeobaculum aegyptiacum TaxID=745377 RepID=A0A2Z2HXQ6_9EURY|nr:hypothetical protein [Natrarchaeobaculum aegyptiacum]ARS89754.1 hypothetical protein B1756_08370 [Natrarchaeobaculum aegyptiacum]
MNRREFVRVGLGTGFCAGLSTPAGCLDAARGLSWGTGVGSLHAPGAIRIGDRDPTDGHGVAALLLEDPGSEISADADLAVLGAIAGTNWDEHALVVAQISRPLEAASRVDFGPAEPERSGLRGLAVDADVRPWHETPADLTDADRLEYTAVRRVDRPRGLVPQTATITLHDLDGDPTGRLEASADDLS